VEVLAGLIPGWPAASAIADADAAIAAAAVAPDIAIAGPVVGQLAARQQGWRQQDCQHKE